MTEPDPQTRPRPPARPPLPAVRDELAEVLAQHPGCLGDVYRLDREGLTPAAMAERLGVPTPNFVWNQRRDIKAILEGDIPTSPSPATNTVRTIQALQKTPGLSAAALRYLADTRDRTLPYTAPQKAEPAAAPANPIKVFGPKAVSAGLIRGDSILTPGTPVWTTENLATLRRDFIEHPHDGESGFFQHLAEQIGGSGDPAIQLFAELLLINLLPITVTGGDKKLEQLQRVIDLGQNVPELSGEARSALLATGYLHGGQAFTDGRWRQINFLIDVAERFDALAPEDRAECADDPLLFRDVVDQVPTGQNAQRQALLFLAFPDYFIPIPTPGARRRVREAFAADYLTRPVGDDVDADLHEIYQGLVAQYGPEVDLWSPQLRARWDKSFRAPAKTPAAEPDTDEVRRAWRVQGSSVNGQDMVPIWRRKGSVSLAAKMLERIEPDISRADLKEAVETGYRSIGYAERGRKFDAFNSFLSRMRPRDLVVTVSAGEVYFGTVTGDAYWHDSTDGRSNLRRPVTWEDHSVPLAGLPEDLGDLLGAPSEVSELTPVLGRLDTLARSRHARTTDSALHLRDPDEQLAQELNVSVEWLTECVELLRDRPQLIFYGPPGTGKTFIAQRLARFLAGQGNVRLVQFHPAYSYEDFFEGYRPDGTIGGSVNFTLRPGPLRKITDTARENPDAVYVLIIDEINRGNLAKIFGELYYLLEYREHGIELLYGDGDERFSLPKNLVILGTMNTADRSIALVDAAMRRRFNFMALHPGQEPVDRLLRTWLRGRGREEHHADLLDELNRRIDDPDFQIGPSYLMREAAATDEGLARVWRHSILPLLEEFHYGDPSVDIESVYGLDAVRAAVRRAAPPPMDATAGEHGRDEEFGEGSSGGAGAAPGLTGGGSADGGPADEPADFSAGGAAGD